MLKNAVLVTLYSKRRKKNNWLGNFWKSAICVPPTPGSQLKKQVRAGGREAFPIKIIETVGRTLDQTLVNTDPFNGNQCTDVKCEPKKNSKNKISCRRKGVCYRVSCLSCLRAGRQADVTAYLECACYYGESAKNMHCRSKEHVSKFNPILLGGGPYMAPASRICVYAGVYAHTRANCFDFPLLFSVYEGATHLTS